MARREANGNSEGGGAAVVQSSTNTAFTNTSFLYGGNAAYVEQLHAAYEHDPRSVDSEWRDFFSRPERFRERRRKERARAVLGKAELADHR